MGENNKIATGDYQKANYAIALGAGNIIADGSGSSASSSTAVCAFAEGSGNLIAHNGTANYAIAMGEHNIISRDLNQGVNLPHADYAIAMGVGNIIGAEHPASKKTGASQSGGSAMCAFAEGSGNHIGSGYLHIADYAIAMGAGNQIAIGAGGDGGK